MGVVIDFFANLSPMFCSRVWCYIVGGFEEIEFDFRNIDLVGPAFADELIRRTKSINKAARIKWINCNKTVNLLMSRALSRIS